MKLVYWYAENFRDSSAYDIRERTRRDAVARRNAFGADADRRFGPVVKVVIEYRDAFDLLEQLTGEGRSGR